MGKPKKGKNKSSKPKRTITIKSKKGVKFYGTFEEGKVKVDEERTAPGQNLTVGVLDINAKKWYNDSLPSEIKRKFELIAFTDE